MLVAMFWTRLGMDTGVAPSGTVQEIERHVAAGKPALICFSSADIPRRLLNHEQDAKLNAFKESIRPRALCADYRDGESFRREFTKHLAQQVNRLHIGPSQRSARVEVSLSEDACALLLEASRDPEGTVLNLQMLDGFEMRTNGRNLITSASPQESAKWRSALKELFDRGYLEDPGGGREVYQVTNEGYRLAKDIGHGA